MSKVFSKNIEFGYFDFDRNKRVKISALLKQIANIGGVQLTRLGYSHKWLYENNMVFLLMRNHVQVLKDINPDESIRIETWAKKLVGATFYRDCNLYDKDNELVATCSTAWLLVDPSTRKVLRPSNFPNYEDLIEDSGKDSLSKDYKKIDYNITLMEKRGERTIVFSDIDINNHLYNAVYGNIIFDYLYSDLVDKKLLDFKITYKNEALINDKIDIYYFRQEQEDKVKIISVGVFCDKVCFESEFYLI